MIRIDEIYYTTFWSYFSKNVPGVSVYTCDPFGRSDPDSVIKVGDGPDDTHNYIFCFDQEPIHSDLHNPTFDKVYRLNYDFSSWNNTKPVLITSEFNSAAVDQICEKFGYKNFYYFFHGWAALDWYRGYDRGFLITPADRRTPTKTFICPNRIIGGKRDHRVLFLYHVFRNQLDHNWISAPEICPVENQSIHDIGARYSSKYKDICQVLQEASLPKNFPGETGHPMHSCWLSLFDQVDDSLLYVVSETVYFGKRNHLTEKTFKPIAQQIPFVMLSTAHSLEYLRRYGFRTFDAIWDESYDQEPDPFIRLEKVIKLLKDLDDLSVTERQAIHRHTLPIVQHNYQHFYGGGFEKELWTEMTQMLKNIEDYFNMAI